MVPARRKRGPRCDHAQRCEIRAAKPRDKDYKLTDSHRLYLLVKSGGSKLWKWSYSYYGKQKTLHFGVHPKVSLVDARLRRDEASALLSEGRDPSVVRKLLVEANLEAGRPTFERVAREWFENAKPKWALVHADDVIRSLERDVFPTIGALPIGELNAPLVLAVLREIESRGAIETTKRVRQRISGVFVFAIAKGLAQVDPAEKLGAVLKPLPTSFETRFSSSTMAQLRSVNSESPNGLVPSSRLSSSERRSSALAAPPGRPPARGTPASTAARSYLPVSSPNASGLHGTRPIQEALAGAVVATAISQVFFSPDPVPMLARAAGRLADVADGMLATGEAAAPSWEGIADADGEFEQAVGVARGVRRWTLRGRLRAKRIAAAEARWLTPVRRLAAAAAFVSISSADAGWAELRAASADVRALLKQVTT